MSTITARHRSTGLTRGQYARLRFTNVWRLRLIAIVAVLDKAETAYAVIGFTVALILALTIGVMLGTAISGQWVL